MSYLLYFNLVTVFISDGFIVFDVAPVERYVTTGRVGVTAEASAVAVL